MIYRKLRIAFSATCGIACLLLIALWVRSIFSLIEMPGWRTKRYRVWQCDPDQLTRHFQDEARRTSNSRRHDGGFNLRTAGDATGADKYHTSFDAIHTADP